MPSSATIVNDSEKGDCVQKQSSSTSGVRSNTTTSEVTGAPRNATTAQTSRKQPGKRKRSCGRTSLAKGDGQPSSEANVNPPRSRRTISTRFGEDDMTTADRAISDSQLVGGTADVPLPSTGRGQGRRSISRRNTRSSRTYDTPGSSSERADEEPDIEPGSSDTRVAEDDLTPTERRIPDTQLLRNLGKHPSVYARAGQNPPTKGLYFRGAWRNAVKLYRAANDQYKQLFIDAGFGDFLQIEPFWAFEYLSISRPEHSEEGEKAFPRAMRWKFAKNIGTLDNSELTASRCQLDDVDDVAQMYGQQNKKKRQSKDEQQSKNEPANHINSGRSAATLVRNDIKDYASWFANNSVGKIVDVNQLIGGPDIGRKVMSHWMATHQPEMILVPESEVKEITEALGTADAELNKLQEELSQIRRGSYS
ncbi:hypothetical protein AG4045_011462 [Apium graveolens]|uniref:Uncharacterized protein n=1 Tax=Apium graveolens TaxID=4045 RepID=A0A6L5BB37_APIGR|nr:hypothetical protein AG4045_011462 [Apium graveolens]